MKGKMLEWTGEGYLPFVDTKISGAEIHYEHLHRYYFALHFVKDKKVLDLACGEGYGSSILSNIFSESFERIIESEMYKNFINAYKDSHLPEPCKGCRLLSEKVSRRMRKI